MITVKKGLQSTSIEGIGATISLNDLLSRVSSIFLIDPDSVQASRDGAILTADATISDGQTVSLVDQLNVKG